MRNKTSDSQLRTILRRRAEGDDSASATHPMRFDPADEEQAGELVELLRSEAVRFVHDTVEEQLRELLESRTPNRTHSREDVDRLVTAHVGGRDLTSYGSWVFYPWSGRLVHVLPVAEHRELRTDRNRYKITAAEQRLLGKRRVGIIGLSVGNMAAVTCALEGIGGSFKLADYDRLSASNLNRLRGSLHEVGVAKTTLAARELAELDPYLEVSLFPDGISDDNLDEFLLGGGRLDVLIEECDDLYLKMAVRERARKHRIPVVMDTSDRGLLDIERFDLEPERPIFHGLVGDVDAASLRGLATKDKIPFFLAIVDAEGMSTRMAASLLEIGESTSSWPQLASSVALGGAIAANAARRILLGELQESGRYYVAVDDIVRDGAGILREPASPVAPEEIAPEARCEPELPPRPAPLRKTPGASTTAISANVVRWLAAHAVLAPSAHNTQPWRLRWRGERSALELIHDPNHELPAFDFDNNATWVAFGAMLENIRIAAAAVGLDAVVEAFPHREAPSSGSGTDLVVASVEFEPAATAEDDPLLAWVPRRVSNRRRELQGEPLDPAALQMLHEEAERRGARLELRQTPEELEQLGELLADAERITVRNESIHDDFFSGFRWSRDEVERTRDGIDLATLELETSEAAGLQVLRQWRVMGEHARITAPGRSLGDLTRKCVAATAAIGLVSIAGTDRAAHLRGGAAVQRLWLAAAARGIALQPMTSLPSYLARLERGGESLFSERQRRDLTRLRDGFARHFARSPDRAEVFLFRAFRAGPPRARSLRRHLDQVLSGI